jgi:hypothetical protein
LKEELGKLELGKILFSTDGEGRNGVYAAILDRILCAFDISMAGQKKYFNLPKRIR